MYIVGLTGGIGSGKSEASKVFTELAVKLIDLDDIAHKITKKNQLGYLGIKKKFGGKYFGKNKELLRKNLQKDLFNSDKTKKEIESILHPIIFDECKKQIKKNIYEEYIVLVIPLLYETKNYLKLIDETLLIDCNEKIQIERIISRDKLDINTIERIIETQLSRDKKIKKADKIINNDSSIDILKDNIYKYHHKLKIKLNGK
ncbi:dephospho-CoA kinase [Nitrosomonadales bacterium]|nr:dephospho-CoA kinase [Nitrosomonadales bacterium]